MSILDRFLGIGGQLLQLSNVFQRSPNPRKRTAPVLWPMDIRLKSGYGIVYSFFVFRFSQTTVNPSELRSIRWLLFGYCIFILYGSFIPFHFNADMGFIRLQFSIFFSAPYQQG